jgi:hypothetical protein
MERCSICHRPLTDPVSIQRGIGPICFGRNKTDFLQKEGSETIKNLSPVEYGLICKRENGRAVTNISHNLVLHSPTGLEFGYAGSGPAELALNTLLQFTDKETALKLHQDFKFQFIANMPEMGGTISADEIKKFIKKGM